MGETGWFADLLAAGPYAAGWTWGKLVVFWNLVIGAAKAGYQQATQYREEEW